MCNPCTTNKINKINPCKEYNLAHAWEDITKNVVYAALIATYPPKTRRCKNCGLVEELVIEHKEEWRFKKYSLIDDLVTCTISDCNNILTIDHNNTCTKDCSIPKP
jgi:hypothetical protein